MKILKRLMIGVSAVSLTVALSGCGGHDKSKDMAVSDALNSDRMLPVVVTNNNTSLGKDYLVWAGYIGDGKIKGMELDGLFPDITYKELTKLSDEKFGEVLKAMGGEFNTNKAQTLLVPNEDNNTTKTVLFKFLDTNKKKKDSHLKHDIEGGAFSSPVEKDPESEWSTIKSKKQTNKSTEFEGYELHIKTTKDRGIKMEKPDEYENKYDNVKIDPEANNW